MNNNAQYISEQIEQLERETGLNLAISDPAKYKENNKKIEKLRKKFLTACNK